MTNLAESLFDSGSPVLQSAKAAILATDMWLTNGHLIADCARLGYLRSEWKTLDVTFGLGLFWSVWWPETLIAGDMDPSKGRDVCLDFRALPFADRSFDAVVFDPPYKLNGTEMARGEDRYGVYESRDWRARLELMRLGVSECVRVLAGGYLLVKCQDQVCSGHVRWQTDLVTAWATDAGLTKVDRFDFLACRAQPATQGQVHARRNSSQLLVFRRSVSRLPGAVVREVRSGAAETRQTIVGRSRPPFPLPTEEAS